MSVIMTWLDAEQGIRYWKFEAEWTWEDIYSQMTPELRASILEYERIDLIVDFSEAKKFPQNFLSNIRNISKSKTDNLGIVVLISTPFTQALLASFYLLNHALMGRYVFVRSMDDALATIQQHRTKSKTHVG